MTDKIVRQCGKCGIILSRDYAPEYCSKCLPIMESRKFRRAPLW